MATTTSNDILRVRRPQTPVTVSTVFTDNEAGRIVNVATDAIIVTLPVIEEHNLGMTFTFRNTGANAAVLLTIAPNALCGIRGTVPNALADSVASGVLNKSFSNTKATAKNGDYVILTAVSLTQWYVTGGVGIWVSQA